MILDNNLEKMDNKLMLGASEIVNTDYINSVLSSNNNKDFSNGEMDEEERIKEKIKFLLATIRES